MLPARERQKPLLIPRGFVIRSAAVTLCLLGGLLVYALHTTAKSLTASREAAEAAHASAVRLVRLAFELQSELDEQEDHDRWTLQLYLQLEREHLPQLHRAITAECKSTRAEKALADFGESAHRHSHAMLQALQRQGARARKRAGDLASSVLSQAKADRQRLREVGGTTWKDVDLEPPLVALARQLRRPNATFELPLDTLREWEDAAATALKAGGVPEESMKQRLLALGAAAPLPHNDAARSSLFRSEDPTPPFVVLLRRARLHRHLPTLLDSLAAWEAHEVPVWDVVELIETLRAQHVFPMTMLRLAEHEWDELVLESSSAHGKAPHAFDADQ